MKRLICTRRSVAVVCSLFFFSASSFAESKDSGVKVFAAPEGPKLQTNSSSNSDSEGPIDLGTGTLYSPTGDLLPTPSPSSGGGSGGFSGGSGIAQAAIEPNTPGENVPRALDQALAQIQQAIQTIQQMPSEATSGQGSLVINGMSQLQSGLAEYQTAQKSCMAAQATASTLCREETSPKLLETTAMVNMAVAGFNSLVVNDACKKFSKVMSIAQAGMTAYIGICGAAKAKCDFSCSAAQKALAKIKAGAKMGQTCTPTGTAPLMLDGIATCGRMQVKFQSQAAQIEAAIGQEENVADKAAVAGKQKLCSGTYALILASAGSSLFSMANSFKQGKQCDKESEASNTASADAGGSLNSETSGGGGTTSSPVASTDYSSDSSSNSLTNTIPVPPSGPSELTSSSSSGTDGGHSKLSSNSNSGGGSASGGAGKGLGAGSASAGSSKAKTTAAKSGVGGEVGGSSDSSDGGGSRSGGGYASDEVSLGGLGRQPANDYRAYLPGESKAAQLGGSSSPNKEITGAGGKSNFEKINFRYIRSDLDQ